MRPVRTFSPLRAKVARTAASLTQTQASTRLAELLGRNVYPQEISRIERGETVPTVNTVMGMARAYGIDWSEFMDDPAEVRA